MVRVSSQDLLCSSLKVLPQSISPVLPPPCSPPLHLISPSPISPSSVLFSPLPRPLVPFFLSPLFLWPRLVQPCAGFDTHSVAPQRHPVVTLPQLSNLPHFHNSPGRSFQIPRSPVKLPPPPPTRIPRASYPHDSSIGPSTSSLCEALTISPQLLRARLFKALGSSHETHDPSSLQRLGFQ